MLTHPSIRRPRHPARRGGAPGVLSLAVALVLGSATLAAAVIITGTVTGAPPEATTILISVDREEPPPPPRSEARLDPRTGSLSPVGVPMPGAASGIDPRSGTLSPVGAVPGPTDGGGVTFVITTPDASGSWRADVPAGTRMTVFAGAGSAFTPLTEVKAGEPVTLQMAAGDECYKVAFLAGQKWVEACSKELWRVMLPVPVGTFQTRATLAPAEMQTQWALRKLGLPAAPRKEPLEPVVVAVIDSGLDYRHPHIRPESIWQNPHPGADPRFPDDRVGWNFVAHDNRPWDDVGHGTFIAGLILALNPAAQIMPVKVLNPLGAGRASDVGRAIVYAVDRGARVVNVSLGSAGLTDLEQWAVDYARARGAVVVVASGNSGVDTAGFGPAGLTGVITVAALDQNDKRAGFANWGRHVSLAAPGVDIVSLRARGTDFVLVGTRGKNYTPGQNIVGADRWFFRASGTSFSAPFVAGAASLLLSRDPNLTGRQVERMLVESAEDVDTAGWDPLTGAGRLDIGRALQVDPNDYLQAAVHKVAPARVGGQAVIQVFGTAIGRRLDRYEIQLGQGAEPARWTTIATERGRQVDGELLGAFPPRTLTAKGRWTVRVVVHDERGKTRESRIPLNVQ
jgi:hypothetical protein